MAFPRKTTAATKTSGFKQGNTGKKHGKRSASVQDNLRFASKAKGRSGKTSGNGVHTKLGKSGLSGRKGK